LSQRIIQLARQHHRKSRTINQFETGLCKPAGLGMSGLSRNLTQGAKGSNGSCFGERRRRRTLLGVIAFPQG
jgi:hypothetical protein